MNRARRIGDGLKVQSKKLLKKMLLSWTLMIKSTFGRNQPHHKNTQKVLHKDITVGVGVVVGAEVIVGAEVVVVIVRGAVQRKRKRKNGHHIAETDQIKDIKVEN